MSKLTPKQMFLAIISEKKVALKISELGLKLINQIITKLSSKVNKSKINNNNFHPIKEDSVSALIDLGYKKMKAYDIIKNTRQIAKPEY